MDRRDEVSTIPPTPKSLGFRMPAEWEKHEATWLVWPYNRSDWPGKFAAVHWVYGEIVRKIVPGETVRILVNSPLHEKRVRRILSRVGVDMSRVEFFHIQTNRSWIRDFGPVFLCRNGKELAVSRFRFNGWARYSDWEKDDSVSESIARILGLRVFYATYGEREIVLEGGSIDVNGRGTLITTEECLLDEVTQVRNPGIGRREIEEVLCSFLGVTNILWLGGGIAGDDTHGHVDDICRFVGPRTVVLCRETNPRDVNYRVLEENRERLEDMRLEDGSKIEVVSIPMPEPLYFNGQRLPASYANFYISNSTVLVPTFNDPNDRIALGILSEFFPERLVVGIHSVDLVWGLGTLHCLTREQPLIKADF
ncbi:MAG: agmatine deiminase [Deltaproteobacteria bacterium]|jgi:agmatine deiminase|nr:MAG: agmatine deiminase [Deltaproteobacteria bacterium]